MSGAGTGRQDLRRVQEGFGRADDALRLTDELNELWSEQGDEVRRVLPRERADAIKAAALEAHATQPAGPGPRSRSLAEATRRHVDLDRLRAAQRSSRRRADDLLHAGGFRAGEVTVRSVERPFDWPPRVEPPASVSTVLLPPFSDGWERVTITEATGDGRVTAFDSYLDAQWGRLGTRMAAQNHDAGDGDHVNLFHLCGFIVPFTMPQTAPLHVTADFTCLVCRHGIQTSDEWGWSDFFAFTQTGVKVDVLWERDDGVSMTEDFRQRFVPGLQASGDGESYPGTQVAVGPGERRSVNVLTDVAFPAGKTVWIFVGMSDFLYARLNDVSVDISMDTAWQLSTLTVTAL